MTVRCHITWFHQWLQKLLLYIVYIDLGYFFPVCRFLLLRSRLAPMQRLHKIRTIYDPLTSYEHDMELMGLGWY